MALLADLRHLTQGCADPESGPDRKLIEADPLAEDVLREGAGVELKGDLLLQAIHALLPQQTHLPVPVAGMGVTRDTQMGYQTDRIYRVLLLPFFLTDTDIFDSGSHAGSLLVKSPCTPPLLRSSRMSEITISF